MSKQHKNLTLSLIAILLLTFSGACKTRTKKKTVRPQATPSVSDTVPDVTIPQPPSTKVPAPEDDFVVESRPDPAVRSETLSADIEELNEQAQQRGWIRDAFFAYGEQTLTAEAQDALTGSATWLKSHPTYNLIIEGHCDDRGTEQYNLALGEHRANTAKEYLVTLGIDGDRIRTVSYGEERPFSQGADEASYAQNRRAHLVLVSR